MNVTAKSRYGLKIMMDLADKKDQGLQQRQSIAERQAIPLDYMDQIVARLKLADLVESIRGRSGGVKLKKNPIHISLWDILVAVEDSLYPVKCLEHETCSLENNCISIDAWDEVFSSIKVELSAKSLHDIVLKWQMKQPKVQHFCPSQTRECGRPS